MPVFMDVVEIELEAGAGGDGCVSFRREKFMPHGGPDGGTGGDGGSIWLVASPERGTLLDFRYRRRYHAARGDHGQGSNKTGSAGDDLDITVPCGTAVFDAVSGDLLGELLAGGDRLRVARGGRGGRGNRDFRTATRQAPDRAQPGRPGEQRHLRLELKLLADIGLIGLPNAGKSTLLARLTAARPKVADYPFTTLVPNLGIADLGDYVSCTIADIPGLVEGASEGRGLGLEFLRHVERTRALLYLVDAAAGPVAPVLTTLRDELVNYGRRLPDLPFAVVVTKQDLLPPEAGASAAAAAQAWAQDHGGAVTVAISAATGAGIDDLQRLLRRLYRESRPAPA